MLICSLNCLFFVCTERSSTPLSDDSSSQVKESPTSRKWQAQISSGFDALVALASSELDRSKQIRRQSATSPEGHGRSVGGGGRDTGSKSPGSSLNRSLDSSSHQRAKSTSSTTFDQIKVETVSAERTKETGSNDMSTFNAAFSRSLTSMQKLSNAATNQRSSYLPTTTSSKKKTATPLADEVQVDVEDIDWLQDSNDDMMKPRTPGRTDPDPEEDVEMEKKQEHRAPAPSRNLHIPINKLQETAEKEQSVSKSNTIVAPKISASKTNPNFLTLAPPESKPVQSPIDQVDIQQFHKKFSRKEGRKFAKHFEQHQHQLQQLNQLQQTNLLQIQPGQQINQQQLQQMQQPQRFSQQQQQNQQTVVTSVASPSLFTGYINLQKSNVMPQVVVSTPGYRVVTPTRTQIPAVQGAIGQGSLPRPPKKQESAQRVPKASHSKTSTVTSNTKAQQGLSQSSGSAPVYPYIELKSHKPTPQGNQQQRQQRQQQQQQISPTMPKSTSGITKVTATSGVQPYGSTTHQYATTLSSQQPSQTPPPTMAGFHGRSQISPQGPYAHPAPAPSPHFRPPYPSPTPSRGTPASTPPLHSPTATESQVAPAAQATPPIPSRMAMRPGMPINPGYPVFQPYVATRPDMTTVPAYIHPAPYPPGQTGMAYRNRAPTPGYIMQYPR